MADGAELLGNGGWQVERCTVRVENEVGEVVDVEGSLFRIVRSRDGVKEVIMFHEPAKDDRRVSLMITADDGSLDGQLLVSLSWQEDSQGVCHFVSDDGSIVDDILITDLVLPHKISYDTVTEWAEAVERGEVMDSFFSKKYQDTLAMKESPEP